MYEITNSHAAIPPVTATTANHLFPVFLKLEEMEVLLVGGGKVALEKLQTLVGNAPATRIEIVAERVKEEVRMLASAYSTVRIREKRFEESDLNGKDLAIVAVDDPLTSAHISTLAQAKKIWVNVADTPAQCDFYLGSIVQKGALKIAISTNGASPTMARRLREVLTDALPDQLDEVINQLQAIRQQLKGDFAYKVQALNSITEVLVRKEAEEKQVG
jgi:uncharacterized protein